MQPYLGALDGDLPPARGGAKAARCRAAGGLSERRRLPHRDDRDRAGAHPDPVPARPLYRDRRPRHLVADAGAAAPDQPDLSGAGADRTRRRNAGRDPAQPHRGRGHRARWRWRGRDRARSRQRRAQADCLPLSRRLRRRPFADAANHRRAAARHRDRAAGAIDLYPRAAAARHGQGHAVLGEFRAQPAPLGQCDGDRRQGKMDRLQLSARGGNELRRGRPRLGAAHDPRGRARFRVRGHQQGGLDRPPAGRRQIPRRAESLFAATRRICGCPMPAMG